MLAKKEKNFCFAYVKQNMGVGSSQLAEEKVHLYDEPNFKGNVTSTTEPLSIHNTKQRGLASTVGSLVVPSGCEVHLYRDSNYKGNHRYFRGPARIPRHDNEGFTTSMIVTKHVGPNDEPKANQAILYYNGRSGLEGILVEAPLEVANISKLGIPNNALSQIKLGAGTSLTVYDDYRYDGASATFNGPFSGDLGGMNGKTGSLKLSLTNNKSLQESVNNRPLTSYWWFWLLLIIIILILIWVLLREKRFVI